MDTELREINQRAVCTASSDDSRTSVNQETVIEVRENEIAGSSIKLNGSTLNNAASADEPVKVGEKCSSFVIDVNCNDATGENQRVCRICHLSAKECGKSLMGLIELGCGCKGELGAAHLDCAEAWFRVRGNRICEICGDTAKSVKGVTNNGFVEAWNDRTSTELGADPSQGGRRCLRGQPLCNFLMACLVITFVIPWCFRLNIF